MIHEGQTEGGHLVVIANQQHVAGQCRVVPGLALDCRESRELRELVGSRLYQYHLTLLRQHEQHILVGQEHELAIAVPSSQNHLGHLGPA